MTIISTLRRFALSCGVTAMLALAAACGSTNPTGAVDKLCPDGAGVAARIVGTPEPIEFCVSNNETFATYEQREPTRYEIAATFTSDSLTILIEVSFLTHTNLPQTLVVSGAPAASCVEPATACIFYREVKAGVYDYASTTVDGIFTLTIADENVAVATFGELRIDLLDGSGNPAGERRISEGFVNVTPGP